MFFPKDVHTVQEHVVLTTFGTVRDKRVRIEELLNFLFIKNSFLFHH